MKITFETKSGIRVDAEAICDRSDQVRNIPRWTLKAEFPVYKYRHRADCTLTPAHTVGPAVEDVVVEITTIGFDQACAKFLMELVDLRLERAHARSDKVVLVEEED